MDRRDFLKTIGAVSLIPVMPVLASTPDLKTWFEQNFDCQYGWPGPTVVDDATDEPYRYKTFAVGVTDSTEADAEKRLSQYFIEKFSPLAAGCPKLYWRLEPQFAEIPVIEFGNTWLTAEDIEDKGHPGVVPQNVELDFDTGSYREVLKKHIVYRMRFRLAIPSRDEQIRTFAKVEGESMENI